MASVRVPGFSPKTNGFRFANAFPKEPIRTFRLANIATLDIGDAANGLCGGMSFTVRDLFEHGLQPPPDPAPPPRGNPFFDYIVDRQIDSFEGGLLPLRFFRLMDPRRPDRESALAELLGRLGIDRHSRTWTMVNVEWPAIRGDIDAGRLSALGLVKVISRDPTKLGMNHQVLAYGYDLDGTTVTLRIADPNYAGDEEVTLRFDAGDPRAAITPVWSRPPDTVHCFFRAPYTARDPLPFR
jgi:hypothetical protein